MVAQTKALPDLKDSRDGAVVGKTIDFMTVDVEGAEMLVLNTVDFTRVGVKILVVELDGGN